MTDADRTWAARCNLGEVLQFTAGDKRLKVANRDLATIVKLEDGKMTVELDGKAKRQVTFDTYSNPKLAVSYSPGDQIHYRTGSPSVERFPHDSTATVPSTNAKKNLLTIDNRDGKQVSYNPIQLRQQTKQGVVYRQEELDLAVGERIPFIAQIVPMARYLSQINVKDGLLPEDVQVFPKRIRGLNRR